LAHVSNNQLRFFSKSPKVNLLIQIS